MQHAIDLTRYSFMRELGDLVLFGTWVYNDDQDKTEPALVLVPRYRSLSNIVPCVVALSAAYKYDVPAYAIKMARGFARLLGYTDSMATTHKIAETIYSHLPDLVSMPNDPKQAVVIGDAVITGNDGKKREIEMIEQQQITQI